MSDWRTQEWTDNLPRGSNKQRFKYCLDSVGSSRTFWRKGGSKVEPTLQDTVEIPYGWVEHIYHISSAFHCNSIVQAGLIVRGMEEVKVDIHASLLRRTT